MHSQTKAAQTDQAREQLLRACNCQTPALGNYRYGEEPLLVLVASTYSDSGPKEERAQRLKDPVEAKGMGRFAPLQ